MRLERLNIHWSNYPKPGGYIGSIIIKGKSGNVDLNLSHDQASEILKIMASAVVETAKDVAEKLTSEAVTIKADVACPPSMSRAKKIGRSET